VLFAFDVIEHDGDDLRGLPLISRSGGSPDYSAEPSGYPIRFNEHLMGDGPTIFDHVCRMGLEAAVATMTPPQTNSVKIRDLNILIIPNIGVDCRSNSSASHASARCNHLLS